MRRVLVVTRDANAPRLIRSIKQAGLQVVALGAPGEQNAPYLDLADEAVFHLGLVPDAGNVRALVEAAMDAGCDAVHPGSGLFAESALLAQAVMRAGMLWVGPEPTVIAATRNRIQARQLALQASIPVVPGSMPIKNMAEARKMLERLGPPVVLKPVEGGGHRDLLRIEQAKDLELSLNSWGLDRLQAGFYMERWLPRVRHIEVQVVGDRHGTLLAVGDREGSVQRHFGKLIEECPAPGLDDGLREGLVRASLLLTRRLEFRGLATVEFLVTPDARLYFLEMNTRLPDSHAVTEEVYGVDLVDLQLRVANGEALGWQPGDLRADGHALAFCIHAEDPELGFKPTSGTVSAWEVPEHARVDSRITAGCRVDGGETLLARLVVSAPARQAAIVMARAALKRTRIEGLTTNLPMLETVTASEAFWRGQVETDFLWSNLGLDIY